MGGRVGRYHHENRPVSIVQVGIVAHQERLFGISSDESEY